MVNPVQRQTIANTDTITNTSVTLGIVDQCGMVVVRGDMASKDMKDALKKATGCAVPDVRKITFKGDNSLAWMSPDEMMVFCGYDQADYIVTAINKALDGQHHLAVNVSDARTIMTVTGDAAREVIAKGAPVDLSKDAFGVGDLRRTRLGSIAAGIFQTSDKPDSFSIFCFRSYSPYLWEWLAASSKDGSFPEAL